LGELSHEAREEVVARHAKKRAAISVIREIDRMHWYRVEDFLESLNNNGLSLSLGGDCTEERRLRSFIPGYIPAQHEVWRRLMVGLPPNDQSPDLFGQWRRNEWVSVWNGDVQ